MSISGFVSPIPPAAHPTPAGVLTLDSFVREVLNAPGNSFVEDYEPRPGFTGRVAVTLGPKAVDVIKNTYTNLDSFRRMFLAKYNLGATGAKKQKTGKPSKSAQIYTKDKDLKKDRLIPIKSGDRITGVQLTPQDPLPPPPPDCDEGGGAGSAAETVAGQLKRPPSSPLYGSCRERRRFTEPSSAVSPERPPASPETKALMILMRRPERATVGSPPFISTAELEVLLDSHYHSKPG